MSKAPNKTADERYTTNLYGVKFILAGTLSEEENSSDSFPPFLLKGLLRLIFNPSFFFCIRDIISWTKEESHSGTPNLQQSGFHEEASKNVKNRIITSILLHC